MTTKTRYTVLEYRPCPQCKGDGHIQTAAWLAWAADNAELLTQIERGEVDPLDTVSLWQDEPDQVEVCPLCKGDGELCMETSLRDALKDSGIWAEICRDVLGSISEDVLI